MAKNNFEPDVFEDGDVVYADQMNKIGNAIKVNKENIEELQKKAIRIVEHNRDFMTIEFDC